MKNANKDTVLNATTWTLFTISGRGYALPSENVIQSIAAPRVQPVPFAPTHVAGIAQVDGEILPCVDLATLFQSRKEGEAAAEALVIEHQQRRTVVLEDSANRQITLDEEDRQSLSALDNAEEEAQAIIGELQQGGATILLLDPGYLSHFSAQRARSEGRPGLVATHADTSREADDQQLDMLFLYITINQQEYALRVTDIKEIVELETVSPLPGAPADVAGISLVRNSSHLVLDAGTCLGIGTVDGNQAVLVPVSQGELLIAVSGIDAVRAVARHHARPVGDSNARLDAVIEVPGEPVRAVINAQALVDAVPGVAQFVPASRHHDKEQAAQEESFRFLVVQWGNERFALPLEKVLRLDPPAAIRRVDSELFEGVISTGGEVVPVLDAHQFYGLEHNADALEGFMIIARDDVMYAVPLEHAERIIDVPESAIQRTQGTGDQRFCGSIRFEDGLISAVELSHFTQLARSAQKALQ